MKINNWKLFLESTNEDELKRLLVNLKIDDNFKKLLHSHPNFYYRSFPPEDLEDELNINGISYTYKIPFNLTEQEYENLALMFQKDSFIVNFLFNELLKINPILNQFKGYEEKFDIIAGACSRIKAEDIKDWIDNMSRIQEFPSTFDLRHKFTRKDGEEIAYTMLWNDIVKKGITPRWFPSMNTLDYIYNKLNKTTL